MGTKENIILGKDGISWVAEERPCPICRATSYKVLGSRGGEAHREKKGVMSTIVNCNNCNVIYPHPMLIPQTNPYDTHSSEEYFYLHNKQEKIEKGKKIADYAESILGKKGAMLELGCGRGEFLIGAQDRGWKVSGVEMTKEFAETARYHNIEVETNSIENCQALNKTYDVILLTAILEHLYEPMECLSKVKNALVSGGLLFIDVPNEKSLTMKMGNLYMKLRQRDWVINLSPTFSPFHVVGFSRSSLTKALQMVGFEIHKIETPKWKNALPHNGRIEQKFEFYFMGMVQTIGMFIGQGDGIECWARRQ